MARNENDREDLLVEATALVERVALELPAQSLQVVVGFRRDGCASVYFGQDPVYQFNSRNELRRLYLIDRRYKAEQGRLIGLEPRRTAAALELVRHELDEGQTAAVLAEAVRRLSGLQRALEAAEFRLIGQVPAESKVIARVQGWLAGLGSTIVVAATPHAR